MKAQVLNKYGGPEDFQLLEVDKPVPKENEVLVKIRATAVNDYDWGIMRGKPYLYRLMFGFFKPKHKIIGMELAGVVEAVGEKVENFKVGDPVYGDTSDFGFGTFAEYMSINEKALVHKPKSMSFEEAATIPHASMLAYQSFYKVGNIKKGQKVLINGAGGGVGTFGLQLCKLHQAEVTGVDTGDKLQKMKTLGFDHVIDYKKEDFSKNGQSYDLIMDCKTTRSPFAHARSLNPGGTYVTVGGTIGRLLQTFVLSGWISLLHKKKVLVHGLKPNRGMEHINALYEEGKIKCVIDGPYKLEEIPRLIQYFGEGKHTGKVVIQLPE